MSPRLPNENLHKKKGGIFASFLSMSLINYNFQAPVPTTTTYLNLSLSKDNCYYCFTTTNANHPNQPSSFVPGLPYHSLPQTTMESLGDYVAKITPAPTLHTQKANTKEKREIYPRLASRHRNNKLKRVKLLCYQILFNKET